MFRFSGQFQSELQRNDRPDAIQRHFCLRQLSTVLSRASVVCVENYSSERTGESLYLPFNTCTPTYKYFDVLKEVVFEDQQMGLTKFATLLFEDSFQATFNKVLKSTTGLCSLLGYTVHEYNADTINFCSCLRKTTHYINLPISSLEKHGEDDSQPNLLIAVHVWMSYHVFFGCLIMYYACSLWRRGIEDVFI